MKTAESGRPTRSSWLVLVGRVLLLLCAASASVIALVVASHRAHVLAPGERYVCPMHPEVTSGVPGDCPICHMALELQRRAEGETGGALDGGSEEARTESLALSYEARALLKNSIGVVKRRVLSQELRLSAWFEGPGVLRASIPTDDVVALPEHAVATFVPSSAPNTSVSVRLTSDPPVAWDQALSRVRFEQLPGAAKLAEGTLGWVVLEPRERTAVVVPDTAVSQGPDGPYVLSVSADGRRLDRRRIEVGRVFSGMAVVTAGVDDHDVILVKNTFFLDAERRLRGERAPASP
jgi:hypothetical protein